MFRQAVSVSGACLRRLAAARKELDAVNLRGCRKRLGISQHELAFRAETHTTAISPLELGQTMPRIDTFIRLTGALETTAGRASRACRASRRPSYEVEFEVEAADGQ